MRMELPRMKTASRRPLGINPLLGKAKAPSLAVIDLFRRLNRQSDPMGQLFGNLNSIPSGSLEELIADDPEGEAVLHRAIAPQASGEAVVLPGAIEWHGIALLNKLEPRRVLQYRAGLLERDGFGELGTHGH